MDGLGVARDHPTPPFWTSSPTTTQASAQSLVRLTVPCPDPAPGPAGTANYLGQEPVPHFHSLLTVAPGDVGANVPEVMGKQEDPGAWAAAERARQCAKRWPQ